MLKIHIAEMLSKHSPAIYLPIAQATDALWDMGVRFVRSRAQADVILLDTASLLDKSKPLNDAVNDAVEYILPLPLPVIIVDGQDSHSLKGVAEIMRACPQVLLLKNSLLTNLDCYRFPSPGGRLFWSGYGRDDYSVPDIDKLCSRMAISGFNWLLTMPIADMVCADWGGVSNKPIDIFAVFGHKNAAHYEYGVDLSVPYNSFRRAGLEQLPKNIRVATLQPGCRVDRSTYYQLMQQSKIVFAPFGFGEIAPRDLEACVYGCLLIKPDMGHVNASTQLYANSTTYLSCQHDFSDLGNVTEYALSKYHKIFPEMQQTIRHTAMNEANPIVIAQNFVDGLHQLGITSF